MKLLFWIVVALVAAVLALFAASNRESVALGLWPLPFVLDLPLYLAILAAVLIGFISGVLATWKTTRRFWARPSVVAFVAIGLALPNPLAVRPTGLTSLLIK